MGHAYTPGLKVSAAAAFTRSRILPIPGDVLVQEGDETTPDTVVARALLPGNVTTQNIARMLGVAPADLDDMLVVKTGDEVTTGQVIAQSKGIFGMFKQEVASPATGVFESYSKVSGQAIFREPPIPVEVKAYVAGKVTEMMPELGVDVSATGTMVQGIFGIGPETSGPIVVVTDDLDAELSPAMITPEHKGAIVVGGACAPLATLRRAIEVGVAAIVTGGIDAADLKELLGFDLGVAITGNEDVGLSLIVTEGFGSLAMSRKTFELLKRSAGQIASASGATQIRAGVMRPEVLIPSTIDLVEETAVDSGLMDIGSSIRIIRDPHFGALATVAELPPEPAALDTEAAVRILIVTLPSGERVTLPRANVELVDEAL